MIAEFRWIVCCAAIVLAVNFWAVAQENNASAKTDEARQKLMTGWSLLKEGMAEATFEADAARPSDPGQKYLHVNVTKTAGPGQGRAGAVNSNPIEVRADAWYDATFRAIADGRPVGMVFSLEGADGKVLARTTFPEIGRVGRGARDNEKTVEENPTPRRYSVALHARGTDPRAHLVMTPIEPTSVWIDELTIAPRTVVPSTPIESK
jgi:hypothetical protein